MKRLMDLVLVLATAPMWLPLFLVTAAVAYGVQRRVLFVQERAGMDGRPFRLLKFQTMTDERNAAGDLLPDADRITPFGARLRSTSLDEIPQLFNVLIGDMSLIGPRPLHVRYVSRYSPRQRTRLAVRPGITGWAQVNGRNSLTWADRLELDAWYVENRSLALDAKILFMTVQAVVRRDGVSHQDAATMYEFMGDDDVSEVQSADKAATSADPSAADPVASNKSG
ncbi:MAG: sugar transferase [Pseudomonadota bacterium]